MKNCWSLVPKYASSFEYKSRPWVTSSSPKPKLCTNEFQSFLPSLLRGVAEDVAMREVEQADESLNEQLNLAS